MIVAGIHRVEESPSFEVEKHIMGSQLMRQIGEEVEKLRAESHS